jgi:hypothetical protein
MKSSFYLFCILTFISIFFVTCSRSKNLSKKVPLFLENEKRAIIVPVKFGDVVAPYMFFDSGFVTHEIQLDSTFCEGNPQFVWSVNPDTIHLGAATAWDPLNSPSRVQRTIFYKPIKINLLENVLEYNNFYIQDMSTYRVSFFNGCFGFPDDSTRVWEFNFEHNYLEIHEADNYEMPANCYKLPYLKGPANWDNRPHIQFPMSIKYANGDTITINELYLLDTGMVPDIVLLRNTQKNVREFFSKRDDATFISNRGNYWSRYQVEATLFDGRKIDSMRVYTNEFSDRMYQSGVIGLNFMKRFNMFFDFKSKQIGFQPIKNFERIVNYDIRRFYFSWDRREDNRSFVKKFADTENNVFKKAGLCEGDEVVSINGIELKNLTKEEGESISNSRIREMNIIRSGKPLKIIVHLGEEMFYE